MNDICDELAKKFVVDGNDDSENILQFKKSIDMTNDNFHITRLDVKQAITAMKARPDNYQNDIPFTFINETRNEIAGPIACLFNSYFPKESMQPSHQYIN
jgi:hypothetical protein